MALSPKPRDRYRTYLKELAGALEQGMRLGVFKRLDPLAAALCMEGMSNGLIAYWVHSGGRQDRLYRPETIEQVFLEGILAGEPER